MERNGYIVVRKMPGEKEKPNILKSVMNKPSSSGRETKTHRLNFLQDNELEGTYSLAELSKISGVSMSVLQEVYNRGIGAYKTNPESVRIKGSFKKGPAPMSKKLSKEQWAMARVYSFLDGNPKHDADLRGE
jgi:hypothetical protein